jgi:hypothetical protein
MAPHTRQMTPNSAYTRTGVPIRVDHTRRPSQRRSPDHARHSWVELPSGALRCAEYERNQKLKTELVVTCDGVPQLGSRELTRIIQSGKLTSRVLSGRKAGQSTEDVRAEVLAAWPSGLAGEYHTLREPATRSRATVTL